MCVVNELIGGGNSVNILIFHVCSVMDVYIVILATVVESAIVKNDVVVCL